MLCKSIKQHWAIVCACSLAMKFTARRLSLERMTGKQNKEKGTKNQQEIKLITRPALISDGYDCV